MEGGGGVVIRRGEYQHRLHALLGHGSQVSYANLVQKLVGVTVDKSQSMTNWDVRPLNQGQLR